MMRELFGRVIDLMWRVEYTLEFVLEKLRRLFGIR